MIKYYILIKLLSKKKLSESISLDILVIFLLILLSTLKNAFILYSFFGVIVCHIFIYNLFNKKEEVLLYFNVNNFNIYKIKFLNNLIYLIFINSIYFIINILNFVSLYTIFKDFLVMNSYLLMFFIIGEIIFKYYLTLCFKIYVFQTFLFLIGLLITPLIIIIYNSIAILFSFFVILLMFYIYLFIFIFKKFSIYKFYI
jgi:hypothetical protein